MLVLVRSSGSNPAGVDAFTCGNTAGVPRATGFDIDCSHAQKPGAAMHDDAAIRTHVTGVTAPSPSTPPGGRHTRTPGSSFDSSI